MTANRPQRNHRIITFLTDFGTADGYAAAMKGVVLSAAPAVVPVDVTHDIPPQDVEAGAWALHQCWRYYPAGTVHVAVVDPGVGTPRPALLAEADGQWFLAPDNGLLSWIFRTAASCRVYRLRSGVHRAEGLSNTFHGRDVFAYVAGLLAAGETRIDEVADPHDSYILGPWSQAERRRDGLIGRVVHVDRFGNLVTNIARADLGDPDKRPPHIGVGSVRMVGLSSSYAGGKPGEPLAIMNSADLLEIAVNRQSAREVLGLDRGDEVRVEWDPNSRPGKGDAAV